VVRSFVSSCFIRRQLQEGATDPSVIASKALEAPTREVLQATRTFDGKERGGQLIDWPDELTMIRAVRSVRGAEVL
jgi:hypothetical protein